MNDLPRRPQCHRGLRFAATLLVAASSLVASAPPSAMGQGTPAEAAPRPRFLVTNDDGWDAPGLAAVVRELARLGEVVVSAPAENQSGSSQAQGGLGRPLRVRPVQIEGATEAFAVEGTPAIAASFGLLQLRGERGFDLVVSGINRGANVGDVSHVSGTVGAAMQAVAHGVRAIASSQDSLSEDYAVAALYTARLAAAALEHDLPVGVVLSINVPAKAAAGGGKAQALPMGRGYLEIAGFAEQARDADGGGVTYRPSLRLLRPSPELAAELAGSDTGAYYEGDITVTPLSFDWTAKDKIEWLRSWLPQP